MLLLLLFLLLSANRCKMCAVKKLLVDIPVCYCRRSGRSLRSRRDKGVIGTAAVVVVPRYFVGPLVLEPLRHDVRGVAVPWLVYLAAVAQRLVLLCCNDARVRAPDLTREPSPGNSCWVMALSFSTARLRAPLRGARSAACVATGPGGARRRRLYRLLLSSLKARPPRLTTLTSRSSSSDRS